MAKREQGFATTHAGVDVLFDPFILVIVVHYLDPRWFFLVPILPCLLVLPMFLPIAFVDITLLPSLVISTIVGISISVSGPLTMLAVSVFAGGR
jgi:hypothetical protein